MIDLLLIILFYNYDYAIKYEKIHILNKIYYIDNRYKFNNL
jgi:hypothetical protein